MQGLEDNLRHLVHRRIKRIKNPTYLPSVFDGLQEVPFSEFIENFCNEQRRWWLEFRLCECIHKGGTVCLHVVQADAHASGQNQPKTNKITQKYPWQTCLQTNAACGAVPLERIHMANMLIMFMNRPAFFASG